MACRQNWFVLAASLLLVAVAYPFSAIAAPAQAPDCAKRAPRSADLALMDQPAKISMFIDALDQSSVSTTMLIDDGAHTYCVSNNFFSDSDSEPPPQGQKLADDGRGRIRWLSPYLLVSHTGGRAEAYDKTWIFKIVEGKLTRMGTVGGDAEMASTGRFQSLYNKASVWQGEEFDCEACRPQVRLVIEDKDGALAANPEATWEINQKEWQDNEKFVASQIQAGLPKDPDAQDLWRMQTLGALGFVDKVIDGPAGF